MRHAFEPGESDRDRRQPARKPRVLVADDDMICRSLTEHTLNGLGVEIHVVTNGLEAVEAFVTHDYDLVLMDCHMPALDGFGAALQMREIEARDRRTPIVALTGTAVGAELERCREVGMDGHLDKLSGPHELRQALAEWLARVAPAPPVSAAADANRPGGPDTSLAPMASASAASAAAASGAGTHAGAGAPRTDAACLDATVLEDLRAFSSPDDDLLAELRASFEVNVAEQLPRLEEAARTGDAPAVRFIAHRLRGTCGNLGARRMQFLCERLETLGRDGVTAGALELTDDLTRAFAQARTAIDDWMRQDRARAAASGADPHGPSSGGGLMDHGGADGSGAGRGAPSH